MEIISCFMNYKFVVSHANVRRNNEKRETAEDIFICNFDNIF